MRVLSAITLLLLALHPNLHGQDGIDFDSIPFVQVLDTLKEYGSIAMDLEPISKEVFLAHNSDCKTPIRNTPQTAVLYGDIITIQAPNSTIEVHYMRSPLRPYVYQGYIPAIQCHFISYCHEICEGFLLDAFHKEKMRLPTNFDQGIIGMPFSPKGNMFLVYSSYDGPDFDNYYEHRAEIHFYKAGATQGLKGLQFLGSFYTRDWSIEDICWIDENTITLKIYSGNRFGDGSKVDYKYFKARIQ